MKIVAIVFVFIIGFGITLLLFQQLYYTLVVSLYHTMIRIASLFNAKAKLWVKGRADLFSKLSAHFTDRSKKTIWVHCASVGEFEQARPIIEQLKTTYPDSQILLTFFSPSGYEAMKNYEFADMVTYLPADTASNAKKFISIVKPDIALFIKYEFWYHHIKALKKNNIPLVLVAGIFRRNQLFFKWYGILHKRMLRMYTRIFVQNEESLRLVKKIKIQQVAIGYDTRFDRVLEVSMAGKSYPAIDTFVEGFNIIVGGSTWPQDERILMKAFYKVFVHLNFKLIVVPHNIDAKSIAATKKRFKKFALTYSELSSATDEDLRGKRVMIIDNIGMLSSLYKYGHVNYIGGGFGKGIHNILEAAVYGHPTIFGPRYKKFNEANELVNKNSAFVITDSDELINRINLMNQFDFIYKSAGKEANDYVTSHLGGSAIIVRATEELVFSS